MQFTVKLAAILMTVTACAMSSRALAIEQRDVDSHQLSVTFFDEQHFLGAVYAPPVIHEGRAFNLPQEWENRARSLKVATGFTCTFFVNLDNQGRSVILNGEVNALQAPFDQGISSMTCHKL